MKKAIIAFTILFALAAAAVAVPQYINYQGILRDSVGDLVTGNRTMSFVIWSDETSTLAANKKWESGDIPVPVSNGLYSVELGPISSPTTIFDGNPRWLGITVAGDLLSPRLKINSVAHAIRADVATTAGSAATANYATLSATASNAATVNDFGASSTPAPNTLLPLDADGRISGVAISPEASGTDFALYINGGKIGIKTSGAGTSSGDPATGPVGTGTLPKLTTVGVDVYNTTLTSSSIIILSVGHVVSPQVNSSKALRVSDVDVNNHKFTVKTVDGTSHSEDIHFGYLIIN